MINQELLDAPVFSFRIGASEEDGGEAVFGGVDDSAYTGDIHYVPVRRKAYWEVELEKVAFGDDELELENTGAAIDTGTSLIALPTDVAEMLNAQCVLTYVFIFWYTDESLTRIGAKKSWNGQYTVDCAKVPDLPELSFFFDGKGLPIEGQRLRTRSTGHMHKCFHRLGHQPPWRCPLDHWSALTFTWSSLQLMDLFIGRRCVPPPLLHGLRSRKERCWFCEIRVIEYSLSCASLRLHHDPKSIIILLNVHTPSHVNV